MLSCTTETPFPDWYFIMNFIMKKIDVITKTIINIYIQSFSLQFYCSSVGAKLVEIETESENNFLKRHLQTIGATSNFYCFILGQCHLFMFRILSTLNNALMTLSLSMKNASSKRKRICFLANIKIFFSSQNLAKVER